MRKILVRNWNQICESVGRLNGSGELEKVNMKEKLRVKEQVTWSMRFDNYLGR